MIKIKTPPLPIDTLTALRESADIMYKIYTEGSCFRLYLVLKTIWTDALPYWSDRDNHCIVEISGKLYDIGGEVLRSYADEKGYYPIPENQMTGYGLLKFASEHHLSSVTVEKYV